VGDLYERKKGRELLKRGGGGFLQSRCDTGNCEKKGGGSTKINSYKATRQAGILRAEQKRTQNSSPIDHSVLKKVRERAKIKLSAKEMANRWDMVLKWEQKKGNEGKGGDSRGKWQKGILEGRKGSIEIV